MKRKFKQKMKNFIIWLMTFLVAIPTLTAGGFFVAPKAKAVVADGPTTTLTVNPTEPSGSNDWYKGTAPTITLNATGAAPITTYYQWDSGAENTYSAPFSAIEGQHNLTYYSVDAGGPETTHTRNFKVDTIKPTSATVTDSGDRSNTKALVFNWLASADATSGISYYEFFSGPTKTQSGAKVNQTNISDTTYALTGLDQESVDDGNWYGAVKTYDIAGNASDLPANSTYWSDGIIVTAEGYILINGTATATDATTVNLTLNVPTKTSTVPSFVASQMWISNNSDFSTGAWEAYVTPKVWSLTSGSGTKTVYVKFKDASSNETVSYLDTILLDTASPTISSPTIISNNTTTTLAKKDDIVTATFTATDDNILTTNPTVTFGDKAMTFVSKDSETNVYTYTRTLDGTETEGSAVLDISVTDQADKTTTNTSETLTTDFTAPTGTVTINSGATITNSNTVALTIAATDAGSGLDKMQFSNDNLTWSDWVEYKDSQSTYALTNNNGDKTIYTKFKDKAGNISDAISSAIAVNDIVENVKVADIVSGTQTITPTDDVSFEITATGSTTLTKADYTANPQSAMESGLTAMIGKYLEFAITDTTKITWPVEVKIYFTQDDLTNANIGSTSQIKGLYFWDKTTSTWKLYDGDDGSTGVTTPSDKAGYLGYVWAKVNHFTPMAIGLDLSAPSAPASFSATVGNKEISLSWSKIDDAAGYYVRYRQVGTEVYTTVYLTGIDSTSTKITGLVNGTEYEFGVAAMDNASNISGYSTVKATPIEPTPTPAPPLPTTVTPAVGGYHPLEKLIPKAKAAAPKEEVKEEGKVKAEETTVETRNWVRILVSLAVLIIIAGAGFAAYAIYEWWVEGKGKDDKKEEEEIKFEIKTEKEKKKRGRKKKNDRSDRW